MHFSSFEMLLQYLKLVGFQNSHFSSFGVLLQYFKLVGVQNSHFSSFGVFLQYLKLVGRNQGLGRPGRSLKVMVLFGFLQCMANRCA